MKISENMVQKRPKMTKRDQNPMENHGKSSPKSISACGDSCLMRPLAERSACTKKSRPSRRVWSFLGAPPGGTQVKIR